MLGKMLQLARAFIDARLELSLILERRRLCRGQFIGHLIERTGERVEFLYPAAPDARVRVAVREPRRREHEFAYRAHDAADRGDGNQQQQYEHRRTDHRDDQCVRSCAALRRSWSWSWLERLGLRVAQPRTGERVGFGSGGLRLCAAAILALAAAAASAFAAAARLRVASATSRAVTDSSSASFSRLAQSVRRLLVERAKLLAA
jgi:hypothetical protein